MKKIMILASATAISLAALAGSVQAAQKIAVVRPDVLISESPQAIAIGQKLEKEFKLKQNRLTSLARKLDKLAEAAKKNEATLSSAQKQAKEKEYMELLQEAQRYEQDFKEELGRRQSEEMQKLVGIINGEIKKYAKKKRYTLILQDAVYFDPKIDITNAILAALKKRKK